jgi:uncharacterized protein with ParB-like and HNH nuclease domain
MQIGILPPELKSIEQLFTGDIRYAVPKYQRSFAWGTDEIGELWEDLVAAINRKGEYFLGTIVLHRKQSGPQEIIDGQQRLASLTMILSAIRNVFLASQDKRAEQIMHSFLGAKDFSRNASLNSKLVLNQTNNETFYQYILESKDLEDIEKVCKTKDLHPSNRLLLEAYKYFLEKILTEVGIKGTQSDEFLVPLIDTLRSQVKLITIPVTSEEDANLFFESLNARGKELAISDLVKNRLYFEVGDQVTRAQQLWEQMENDLGTRPIPEYLRHYWIAKKTDARSPNVREKQLYRIISQDIGGKKTNALDLVNDLRKTSIDYAKISDRELWPDNPAYDDLFIDSLEELRLFRVTQCNPLLINAIQTFTNPKDIAKTFRIVTNFSFRYFIIGNQSPGNLERISANIAYEIRAGTYPSPNSIADAFRAISTDPSFRSDFSFASISKSRARIARYILAKISNHLSNQEKQGGSEHIVNPNSRHVNLEHVLPQDLRPPWPSYFPKTVNPADFVYRLGNLTLLTSKVNRDAADVSYSEKKRLVLEISDLAINKYFKSINKWDSQQIDQRQDSLAKTALEVWRL